MERAEEIDCPIRCTLGVTSVGKSATGDSVRRAARPYALFVARKGAKEEKESVDVARNSARRSEECRRLLGFHLTHSAAQKTTPET